jgi:hypothetical protein
MLLAIMIACSPVPPSQPILLPSSESTTGPTPLLIAAADSTFDLRKDGISVATMIETTDLSDTQIFARPAAPLTPGAYLLNGVPFTVSSTPTALTELGTVSLARRIDSPAPSDGVSCGDLSAVTVSFSALDYRTQDGELAFSVTVRKPSGERLGATLVSTSNAQLRFWTLPGVENIRKGDFCLTVRQVNADALGDAQDLGCVSDKTTYAPGAIPGCRSVGDASPAFYLLLAGLWCATSRRRPKAVAPLSES